MLELGKSTKSLELLTRFSAKWHTSCESDVGNREQQGSKRMLGLVAVVVCHQVYRS